MAILKQVTIRILLQILFGILLVTAVIWYAHFQARNFIAGPQITLRPILEIRQTERVVTLAGETRNIVSLSLNGRTITTDTEGFFYERLVLENGYTIMTLEANDRFGRTTSIVQPFVYTGEM